MHVNPFCFGNFSGLILVPNRILCRFDLQGVFQAAGEADAKYSINQQLFAMA